MTRYVLGCRSELENDRVLVADGRVSLSSCTRVQLASLAVVEVSKCESRKACKS
jgi:hypothetical protein